MIRDNQRGEGTIILGPWELVELAKVDMGDQKFVKKAHLRLLRSLGSIYDA